MCLWLHWGRNFSPSSLSLFCMSQIHLVSLHCNFPIEFCIVLTHVSSEGKCVYGSDCLPLLVQWHKPWSIAVGSGVQTQSCPHSSGGIRISSVLFPSCVLHDTAQALQNKPWFAMKPFGIEIRKPRGSGGSWQLHPVGQGVLLFWTLKLLSAK